MGKLAPSILAADFAQLGQQCELVTSSGADYLHIDVMDGHFVPNISFGAAVMKSLNRLQTAPYDVHLMIEDPDRYAADFVTDKTEYIVVHQEACRHLHRSIQNIKALGVKAGVAINPATPVAVLEEILRDVDLVLVMSVNPGFGGQKFIDNAYGKIRRLKELREQGAGQYVIEVDGGVTAKNAAALREAGCDLFVAGSEVFRAEDIPAKVRELKALIG
ncbi:MAG: ribulose-phosphate 3-epimerase [Firmicutes bacterium]|nr:ribulose-phosphate 3-epimerase [Bacillota bacterium]